MKKILIGLVFLSTLLFSAEIHWLHDFKLAMTEAKKQHKPIIFVATKDGCKYCTMLKTTTLQDKDVIKKINEKCVALKLNLYEKGSVLPYMLAVYTKGFPTIWFLNEDGKALFEPVGGYVKAKEMRNILNIVDKSFNTTKGTK